MVTNETVYHLGLRQGLLKIHWDDLNVVSKELGVVVFQKGFC